MFCITNFLKSCLIVEIRHYLIKYARMWIQRSEHWIKPGSKWLFHFVGRVKGVIWCDFKFCFLFVVLHKIPEAATTKVSNPKRYSLSNLRHSVSDTLSRAHTVRFLIVFCDCCLSHCTNMIPMSNCRISVVLMSDCTTVKTRQKRTYSRKTCPEFYVINPWPAFSRYNGR